MKLLTQHIKDALPKLGATENTSCDDKTFVCKFFNPMGDWTWLVAEGEEQEDGDWMFFGLVDGFEKEWGYFSLSELEGVDVGFGMGIERDICFGSSELHPEWATM
tara:strand:+ start:268 stop:582 length:315 start_codon:yes stop_codon:yes gene_type:complete